MRNIRRSPKIGVSVLDPDDLIDELGPEVPRRDEYPYRGDESGPRVTVRVSTDRVVTGG